MAQALKEKFVDAITSITEFRGEHSITVKLESLKPLMRYCRDERRPFILEARRNGAKFYVIDPVKNKTGKLADKCFGIYPGSDAALALGLAHVILAENLQDDNYIREHTKGLDSFAARAKQTANQIALRAAEYRVLQKLGGLFDLVSGGQPLPALVQLAPGSDD